MEKVFHKTNKTVKFFMADTSHRIILNVFTNFVPNKVITNDDRDQPWINDNKKIKIRWKNSMYKNYERNGKKNWGLRVIDQGCIWSFSVNREELGWVLLPIGQTIKWSQHEC